VTETEVTEVRDHTVPADAMLGQVAVQSQMRTKQIGAKQLPIARRIIAKAVLRIRYFPLADEAIGVIETVRGTVISIGLTAVDARTR
jgi:hypothetical protein